MCLLSGCESFSASHWGKLSLVPVLSTDMRAVNMSHVT